MIGLLVQFAISYLLIWWIEKGNLSFMGLSPTWKRMKDFVLFFLVAAACSSITFFLRMYFGQERWSLNPDLSLALVFKGLWYHLKSVLFEELIFRGVLFYLLIRKWGTKALWISAAAFGVYHWFTYEIFNDPVNMVLIFLLTGLAGVIYGLAYIKTGSLYTPIAMHLGWNLVGSFAFSNGNIGPGIWIQQQPPPQVQVSVAIYLLVSFLHFFLFYLINFFLLKKRRDMVTAKVPSQQ